MQAPRLASVCSLVAAAWHVGSCGASCKLEAFESMALMGCRPLPRTQLALSSAVCTCTDRQFKAGQAAGPHPCDPALALTKGNAQPEAGQAAGLHLREPADRVWRWRSPGPAGACRETTSLKLAKLRGCTFVNQYVVIKYLGRGACGRVFLCMDMTDNRLYAVKARPAPLCPLCCAPCLPDMHAAAAAASASLARQAPGALLQAVLGKSTRVAALHLRCCQAAVAGQRQQQQLQDAQGPRL